MRSPFNVIIAGVGGQGNLVCGRSLAMAAISQGLNPVLGDTFGASRRGGGVVTHLRIAKKNLGPLIPKGHLDLILGMEPMEALRAAINFGGENTVAVFSNLPILSPATLSGNEVYPEITKITEALKTLCSKVHEFDARSIIQETGTHRVLNVYMLGVLVGLDILPLEGDAIKTSIDTLVGMDSMNLSAFQSGQSDGEAQREDI